MKLAVGHLLKLERSGTIRWNSRSGLSLENGKRPPVGSTLEVHASSGRSYACKLSGYSDDEAVIQYAGPLIPPDQAQEFVDTLLLGQ